MRVKYSAIAAMQAQAETDKSIPDHIQAQVAHEAKGHTETLIGTAAIFAHWDKITATCKCADCQRKG